MANFANHLKLGLEHFQTHPLQHHLDANALDIACSHHVKQSTNLQRKLPSMLLITLPVVRHLEINNVTTT